MKLCVTDSTWTCLQCLSQYMKWPKANLPVAWAADDKHVHYTQFKARLMAVTAVPWAPQHPACFKLQRGMTDRKQSSRVAVQAASTLHTTTAEGCGCAAELKVGPIQLLSVSLSALLTARRAHRVFYTVLLSTYKYSKLYMDRGYQYGSVAANHFLALRVQMGVRCTRRVVNDSAKTRIASFKDRQFTSHRVTVSVFTLPKLCICNSTF